MAYGYRNWFYLSLKILQRADAFARHTKWERIWESAKFATDGQSLPENDGASDEEGAKYLDF